MPSPFDITVASNTVTLDNNREGVAAFTVHNNTRRRLHATAKLSVQPPDGVKWLTIQPNESGATDVRDFPIDGTQNFQVKIAAPPAAAPGSYTLKLSVADEVNPDDNFTDSPDVVFTVREIPKPAPRPFPWWIVAAVIAVVVVIVAVVLIAKNASDRQAEADLTATQIALNSTRAAADANATATQAAANANATATQLAADAAIANATATQVAAVATQTALNVYIGSWVPTSSGGTPLVLGMSISDAGQNRLNLTYSSNCPPQGNICLASAQSFTITNIPYNSTQLAGGIQNTTMLIQPANSGQLVVTVQTGSNQVVQTMRRARRFEVVDLTDAVLSQSSIITQAQINQLQFFAPTDSP